MNEPTQAAPWQFVCPLCQGVLDEAGICANDGRRYQQIAGIWQFLPPERAANYAQFVQEYETVRQAEGRGSLEEAAYYRALPFADLSGTMPEMWSVRAKSFQTLLSRVIEPLTAQRQRPLRIVDMGAGNGWLTYQLARRGHTLAAVDLTINPFDGLGAHTYYDVPFTPIQAEFDSLPLAAAQADVVIFNASFHYTPDYEQTLREAWRVLLANGRLIICDTPVYHKRQSGEQMVKERQAHFQQLVGFPSDALPSQNFLTYQSLAALGTAANSQWQLLWPTARWRWFSRRLRTALRQQREPAQFPLIIGRQI